MIFPLLVVSISPIGLVDLIFLHSTSILIVFNSHSDYKEAHVFSFSRRHPSGVAAVTYAAKHNLLVVAGFDGDEPTLDEAGWWENFLSTIDN